MNETMANDGISMRAELAEARGWSYGLLANALRYPDRAMLNTLLDRSLWADWPEVIRREDSESADRLAAIRERLGEWVGPDSSDSMAAPIDLQQTFTRLFGHTVRGACPPYELEYGRGEIIQQSSMLADLTGFYSAFGLEPTSSGNERPDHVSTECEFMAVLAAKEAYAIRQGDTAATELVRNAARSFLEEHLGRWLPSFARRIVGEDSDGLYGAIGGFAGMFVASECRQLDISCDIELLELRPDDGLRDATMTCGPDGVVPADRADSLVQVGIDPTVNRRE